jgi:ATP-binding cassette subfamily B protein
MAVFYLISSLLAYLLSVLMIHLGQKVIFRLRTDVFNKLTELPVRYFDSHQTGEIISRISYDIDTVNTSLSTDLVQIFTSVITVVGSLAMMVRLSPVLVLVFTVTLPITVLFRKPHRKADPLSRNARRSSRAHRHCGETVTAQKTVSLSSGKRR